MTETVSYPTSFHRDQLKNASKATTIVINKQTDSTSFTRKSEDTCGLYGIEILSSSIPVNLKKLGIQEYRGSPCYLDKVTKESRLKTYKDWPKSIKQKPDQLAEAGFFYIGIGDKTKCFHCGGGLGNWEVIDDPWEQHALWFSDCEYVNIKKGPAFVANVKAKLLPVAYAPNNITVSETKENLHPTVEVSLSEECEKLSLNPQSSEQQTLCKICFTNELGVVFLPCGHIVACVDCAPALTTCAICRKTIEATVRAFLS